MPVTDSNTIRSHADTGPWKGARLAVGVNGHPEGRDAAALAATLASATGADVMLVAVVSNPLVIPLGGMSWRSLHKQAHATLAETRDALVPHARMVIETDVSVARALERVVRREHRDLLVVGSSRHAPEGRVRIGKRTRQLLGHAACALAVAPRGMHHDTKTNLTRIGVGYDGSPESEAALALAASISLAAGAQLLVRGVVDDRISTAGWSAAGGMPDLPERRNLAQAEVEALLEKTQNAVRAAGAHAEPEVQLGRPADGLLELCASVDLLVIGSRRWGPIARVILGSTGETLLHGASCPILVGV